MGNYKSDNVLFWITPITGKVAWKKKNFHAKIT